VSQHLSRIVESIKRLEPLPQVAIKVLELARHRDTGPRDLAAVIETDPAITARVLKLCNSAYYGFQRRIASLDEASTMLGTTTLTSLVLTSCTARYFRGTRGADPAREALWERSIHHALTAGTLAQLRGNVDRQRAYTAGLLMDIGELVLLSFTDGLEEVAAAVADGDVRLAAEERVFGLHHAEIGARLLENWNLPDPLIDAVRNHHRPRAAAVDQALCGVAHMAESVTEALASGQGLASLAPDLARWSLDLDGMAGLSVGELETLLHEELERAKDLVAA
jgi:HD-like signal output (HDOD) protein